jgi:hypothetical protein
LFIQKTNSLKRWFSVLRLKLYAARCGFLIVIPNDSLSAKDASRLSKRSWGDLGLDDDSGVWVAFNYDRSSVIPFSTEVEALRYANSNYMHVKKLIFGKELLEGE